MINPINKINEYKVFTEQNIKANVVNSEVSSDNNVSKDLPPENFVKKTDSVQVHYDVDKYVSILKNMVIPPEDRVDVSVLLELELNNKITVAELREMIQEVEREELRRKDAKVNPRPSVNDSSKEVEDKSPRVKVDQSDTDIGKEANN